MNRFAELFRRRTAPPPGQIYADDRSAVFPEVVSHSPRLRLWDKNAGVPSSGRFLLVGVATWSGYDMKLLDVLESTPGGPEVIGVFDTADCRSNEDFEARIPGIGTVFQTPVVGLWENGHLVASASGHAARKIAFEACSIDPERIHEVLSVQPASA